MTADTPAPIRRECRHRKATEAAPGATGRAPAYTRASTWLQVNDGETLEVQDG